MWREDESAEERRITLEHLRAFAAVAETGGFQKAAEALYRSQSAVTQSVRKLEQLLNCTLLERRHGHVEGLTGDGARFFPEARDILRRLDAIIKGMQRPELKGHLSIGIPPSFSTAELQSAIAGCMAINPGLTVRVVSTMSTALDEMLEQGKLDAAILSRKKSEYAGDGERMRIVLQEKPLQWIYHKWEDFSGAGALPIVTYTEGSPWRETALAALEEAGREYYFSFLSASYESVCSAVLAGFGLSALPAWDIDGRFTILTEAEGLPPLPPVGMVLKMRSQSPLVRRFCEIIAALPCLAE